MPSVLYVLARVRPGGSLTLVRERVRRLVATDVHPQVCALLPTADNEIARTALAEWAEAGVVVHVLGHRSRRDIPLTVAKLARLARGVDVVHNANGIQSHVIAAALLARRPLVRDLISTAPPEWMSRASAKATNVNVAISHAVAEVHRAPRTTVIYPPLDLLGLTAEMPGDVPTGDPTILTVARFAPGKGLQHLPGIAAALVRHLPDMRLLIAGDGPEREELEAGLVARNVADRVTLLGFRTDIPALHRAADIYLSTSEAEGLVGYATLEAVLAGTPVVASSIPAVAEVLRDGVDALLTSPSDAEQVASAISSLAENPPLARRLAGNAKERINEVLNPDDAVAALADLYAQLSTVGWRPLAAARRRPDGYR